MLASKFIVVVEQLGMDWAKREENGHAGILVLADNLAEFYPLLDGITGVPSITHMDEKLAHYYLSCFKREDELITEGYEPVTAQIFPDYDTLPEKNPNNKEEGHNHVR